MLQEYLAQKPCKVQFKKMGDGYYKFGSKRIYLKLDNDGNTLQVRVGSKEFVTLSMFIIENEGIENAESSGNSTKVATPTAQAQTNRGKQPPPKKK